MILVFMWFSSRYCLLLKLFMQLLVLFFQLVPLVNMAARVVKVADTVQITPLVIMLMDRVRPDAKLAIKHLLVKRVRYYFNSKLITLKQTRCTVNKLTNDTCTTAGKHKNKVPVLFYWKEMDYFHIGTLNLNKRTMRRIMRYLQIISSLWARF